MFLVTAYVFVNASCQNSFEAAAEKCVKATRKEPGNISYSLYKSSEDEFKYMIFEEWVTEEALELHKNEDHFLTFVSEVKDLLSAPLDIKLYSATQQN